MNLRVICVTLVLGLAASVSTAAPAAHLKVSREHSFTVALPVAEAFPLFEPVGEKKWAEGWNPVFPSPGDLPLHNGSVFTVEAAGPGGHGVMQSVWSVSRHEPPRLIEYRNVVLGLRATRIAVECVAAGENQTRVTVCYEYTGLSADGDVLIGQITTERFAAMISEWEKSIAAYLKRGTPATP